MKNTLILTRDDVASLLSIKSCIRAVESAFALLGRGEAAVPATMGVMVEAGGFHIKAGTLNVGAAKYFAVKSNGNFPANPRDHGLPTIQGVVLLCDAANGRVLAVMDSAELTARRTAAATAVAARYLARSNASVVLICGCGMQAVSQLEALRAVLPISNVLAYDVDSARSRAFAAAHAAEPVSDIGDSALRSDVVVTCTTSTEFLLFPEHLKPGTFVAAVGVDNAMKKELAPALLASATVVTDSTGQCAQIGDLHHAIAAGVMTAADVHAELPAIVAGRIRPRVHADEVIVFDSTGMGIQDVAAAAEVYERARAAEGAWLTVDFA